MKKNIVLLAAVALTGAAIFTFNNLSAQTDATTAPPPAAQSPQPNRPAGPPPGAFRGRARGNYSTAVIFLRRAKMDLEHAKDEYDGHRQTALEAVDKAIQELEAVQAAVTKAAAAQQAPPPASPSAPAPASPAPPQ